MAYCNVCGTNVPDNATNCPVCGSVMAAQAAPQPQAQPYAAPQPQAQPYAAPQPQAQPYAAPQPQPTVNPYSAPAAPTAAPNPYSPQGTYAAPAAPVQQVIVADPNKDVSTAKTLGIVAIIAAFIWPLVSWICGGIGISKANSVITMAQAYANPYLLSNAESAKKLNKIGIILSIVLTVLSILLVIIASVAGVMAGLDY